MISPSISTKIIHQHQRIQMKQTDPQSGMESLYLEVSTQNDTVSLPLHSSIVLFLLSYTECTSFRVFLVTDQPGILQSLSGLVPEGLSVSEVMRDKLPELVRMCRLPAALEPDVCFCRAGLAVVLRHIIQRTCKLIPGRRDVASLLGFKNTCLKACAEVSQWTRLCELDIPCAVEKHLQNPEEQVPSAILNLEKRLGEPVKVHNDDKIRRQKLQQQKKTSSQSEAQLNGPSSEEGPLTQGHLNESDHGVELSAALAKLSVNAVPAVSTRECSDIRKVKTTDLPELEHVFAEGLYFTLTDVVLLPCIHQYLISLQKHAASSLSHLPLLLSWYQRVQELPSVLRAAKDCGMALHSLNAADPCPPHPEAPQPSEAQHKAPKLKQQPFIGGPRPTLTKLQDNGIDAVFSPHPCPSWTLDWESLPVAVNPTEGKMSDARAIRKQQQLNNLVAMVTEMARPGHIVVDFCSGGGHVGIVLAHRLPKCQVILIENKEESLVRARDRSAQLGLTNIGFIQTNLDYFIGNFNIGVALHACGVATDMVLDRCLQARAGFVVSPCCYGFIQNTLKFNFPKSTRFAETLSYKEHMILCRFADQTAVSLPTERRSIGKRCMGLVDLDRSWAAETQGYSVRVMTMVPEGCSPKNNMLVGEPTR
ncbi:glutathione S-transferase C-terminal domain-containing protein isoform X2 [Myxocyprinus asiaticus]|uniref:glutathione S-transferase C-terminal domain-containing protein isoform X2 n=1 Tax=Myxocyprinus asiaticus TaxID=70543 RepID=UPI002223DF1F|nr:glutathione S-transferase C-terminal domain-containing protein isoform X2 [Myxocyprinus asiaticus]